MKNALHLPVIVLAILYMHLTAQAQSDSDAVYVETPVKSAIQETPRSIPPAQTALADACGYSIAIRLIGTALNSPAATPQNKTEYPATRQTD